MKTTIITIGLILFLFSGTTLRAQDSDNDSREKFSFGVKAGLNHSNVWDEQGQSFIAKSKFGFAGGLFLGIPIGEALGFQPELLLSQKGFKATGVIIDFPYSFTQTATYVDVPLQLQIKPAGFLTLLVGPQYSYLVHVKNVYTFASDTIAQEQEFDNDNIRKNIFGVVFGADVNLDHFVISGRYGWDLINNHGDGTSSTPRYKNKWLQVTIGFKI